MVDSILQSHAEIVIGSDEKLIRVLHVDDELALLNVAKQCLELQGTFQVDTASSVEEALAKLEKERYDAVVSDFQMPGKDGLEFLEMLRKNGNTIPFIIFTGKGREEVALRAWSLGGDHYINKTGDPETVYCELAHCLRTSVEKHVAKARAEETIEKFEGLFRHNPEAAVYLDANFKMVDINHRFSQLFGYSSEEVKGKNINEVVVPEDMHEEAERLDKDAKNGYASHDTVRKRKDGSLVPVSISAAPVTSGNNLLGYVSIYTDVTERKKVEEEESRLIHDLHERAKELNCFYGMSRLFEKSDISLDDALQGTADLLPPAMQYPDITCARVVVENLEFSTKNFKETRWNLQTDIKVFGKKAGSVEICLLEERPTVAEAPFLEEERHLIDAVAERLGKITERKKAEQASKESEEKSRSIVENSSDQIFMLDRDCRFLSVNKMGADLFSLSPQEMVGRPMSEVFPETIAAQFSKNIKNVFETGKSMHMDERMVVEGRELYNSTSLNPVRDDRGRVIAVTGIVRDITESKKAEKMLWESEERFRAVFEEANDGILAADTKTRRFAFANPRICEITGYSLEELLKLGVGDIHPKKDLPHVVDSFTKLVQGKLTLAKDLPVLRKDEKVVYCDISARSVKIGSQEYLLGLFRDVTERKKTEQTLRASLERYQSFIEVTGELGWTTNADGEVVEDTPSFRKFSGQTYEEVKGWGWSKALHPNDVERVTQIWKEATRTKSKYETEFRLRRHDGVYRYFMARSVPVLNEDGSIREWVGTCIDITERKMIEDELMSSQEQLRVLFEYAPDAYYLNDLKGNFIDGNLAAQKITGYDRSELVGKNFSKLKLLSWNQIPKAAKHLALNAAGKPTGPDEFTLNRKDGTQVPVEIRTYPVKIKDKAVVLAIARDITERKKAETLVLQSHQRFQSLFSHNPEATIYIDVDSTVVDINQRFATLFGYSSSEVKGKNINALIVPKDHIEEAKVLDRKAVEDYVHIDTVRMKKDKSSVSVSISAAPVIVKGQSEGYIAVYKDISQLRKTEEELREMMEKLQIMNEKLRVTGSLTRHDVRNKLTAATGNVYLARKKLPENSQVQEYLGQIDASIKQTVRVLDFAKTYEMLGAEQLGFVNLENTVSEAISLCSNLNEVKVINDCQGLTVLADSLLRQLFYDLIDDSLKYGKKLSRIRIHYEEKSDHLNIIYEDDGVGIPASEKPKLFNQGYSTGGSTGYGLYLIKKISEVYGWTIKENGEPGEGVVFVITVPKTNKTGINNYEIQNSHQ